MNYDESGAFKLLPDEASLIRLTLRQEWEKQRIHLQIISDNICLEYRHHMQRNDLDSYMLFKRCLKDLSCVADTLRKFGIDKKLDGAQTAVFMCIYADVIHTVTGWNEYKSTIPDCLNIISFSPEQYVRWKDTNIKGWAFEHGIDADSKITQEHVKKDY